MKYAAIFAVIVTLGIFANLVHESKMLSYLSSDPRACINCHTMTIHYATWEHSSHRNRATCVDCHLPRDSFVNKMLAKARDGYHHSVAMTFKTYGPNLRISSDAAKRIQDNCIACHQKAVSQMMATSALYEKAADSTVQMGRRCWDCHRGLPHGTMRNLSATQNNFSVKVD
ncbi:MAG: cytochrome c nitrite reductase small subunit [Desulfobulbus sp.]|jgi:cytochrome c nitrite reductase small subunit|uniref:cytochrome c nitrite reductase small subunit n=1 Tax=Desulfobulbus sp. TaxID=895 RepID=UPI00284E1CC5|nr:cytochrome c nitrite reductase small subunit [Desulfobulbus sp.]MDR2550486.1 cytochrome c nitrite reductase small subunit [Desulfobulbus sp.]